MYFFSARRSLDSVELRFLCMALRNCPFLCLLRRWKHFLRSIHLLFPIQVLLQLFQVCPPFKLKFSLHLSSVVKSLLLSVASDDYSVVWINGVQVDSDPVSWHEAAYWNRRIYVNPNVLVNGNNVITVKTVNYDTWAFFDCELRATYSSSSRTSSFHSQIVVNLMLQSPREAFLRNWISLSRTPSLRKLLMRSLLRCPSRSRSGKSPSIIPPERPEMPRPL